MFVLGALALLLVMALPLAGNNKLRSDRLVCANNLRQIGVGFQTWSDVHEDQVPWMVSQQSGGTATGSALMDLGWYHFLPLSNYVSSPSILACPSDDARISSRWDQSANGGFINSGFRNNALSYLVGCHADITMPVSVLSADRNMLYDGISTCSVGFRSVAQITPFSQGTVVGWNSTNVHRGFGNLLTVDGNVMELSSGALRKFILQPASDNGSDHYLLPR